MVMFTIEAVDTIIQSKYVCTFKAYWHQNVMHTFLALYLKPVISDNTDKVHQIGTAYLVQHCLCCNLFALMSKNKGMTTEEEEMKVRLYPQESHQVCRSARAKRTAGMEEVVCAY